MIAFISSSVGVLEGMLVFMGHTFVIISDKVLG